MQVRLGCRPLGELCLETADLLQKAVHLEFLLVLEALVQLAKARRPSVMRVGGRGHVRFCNHLARTRNRGVGQLQVH